MKNGAAARDTADLGVILVQPALPAYRQPVIDELVARLGSRLVVLAGDVDFDPTIHTQVRSQRLRTVRNVFLLGRRLVWQRDVLVPAIRSQITILDINPRNLTGWIALLARRLLHRPTVVWGHAWPRRGPGAATEKIRRIQRTLGNVVVVYTRSEAIALTSRHPQVLAAPNALYRRADMHSRQPTKAPTDILCVGRLVRAKKPELLFDAFLLALPHLPPQSRLVFVGDGPLRPELELRARLADVGDRVVFEGSVNDTSRLRGFYSQAVLSASPGYVGLSLIQSLAYGTPMLIAANEPHAPEIEAARDGFNALFAASDDPGDFAARLVDFFDDGPAWAARAEEISVECREAYSVEAMIDGLVGAIALASR